VYVDAGTREVLDGGARDGGHVRRVDLPPRAVELGLRGDDEEGTAAASTGAGWLARSRRRGRARIAVRAR
jgi:hypothetical protein